MNDKKEVKLIRQNWPSVLYFCKMQTSYQVLQIYFEVVAKCCQEFVSETRATVTQNNMRQCESCIEGANSMKFTM